jgi:hypothetical protein
MRYAIIVSVLLILNGCAHSSLENRVCDGFQEWVATPIESNEKSLSFDWRTVDEESIPFYANMITQGSADIYDKELYEKAAQATHYIELRQYANIVASCLKLRKTTSEDNRLFYFGSYQNREVSVVWENKYCGSEISDNNGCFTISKK